MSSKIISNNRLINILSLFISLVVMHKTLGFIGHLSTSYYFAFFLLVSIILIFLDTPRINITLTCFFIYIAWALLILNPPSVFSPWPRYLLFVTVLAIASPIFKSNKLRLIRQNCLRFILTMCVIISVISFFCYFAGLNFMRYTADIEFSERGGLFGGLTEHSIILGIVSGISICFLAYKGLTLNWRWFILSLPCIGSLLFSASRGALVATIIGLLTITIVTHKLRMSIVKIRRVLLIAVVAMGFIVGYTDMMSGIQYKMSNRDSSSMLSSREEKLNYRIEEFKSSPIIGIGFSTISIDGGDDYNSMTGTIEPGSSWFALLSMTGIVGTLLFIFIYIKCYIVQIANKSPFSILLLGLLSFFVFSMFSEGYIFAAGSPLCFLLWLVIGCSIDNN